MQCPTIPPKGYALCTREAGHDGPCAMGYEKSIFGEAEHLRVEVTAMYQKLGHFPDVMVLPWRLYWGWVLGGFSLGAKTRIRLNPFRLVPYIHWTIKEQ